MKNSKLVQIVITDDATEKNQGQRIIFDVYRSVNSAVQFLKELGITVSHASLQRVNEFSNNALHFEVNSEYDEKLMKLCPVNRRINLNEALDNQSAHIGILPMVDLL